jgi:hypothetical protein
MNVEVENNIIVNSLFAINTNKPDNILMNLKKNMVKKQEAESFKYDNLDYKSYFKNNVDLTKLKLVELKKLCSKYKLHVTGTKPILIGRIKTLFEKSKKVVLIQSIFRRRIVIKSIRLRGPALTNRRICVNDTDFVTLEPLSEVPNQLFYSYTDNKDFTYGFNITSLLQIIKMKGRINNPYNREKLDKQKLDDIITLYNISFLIYSDFKIENEPFTTNRSRPIIRNAQPTVAQNNNHYVPPPIFNLNLISEEQQLRLNRLTEIRERTVNQRINDLFMELDQLGNYTNSFWFTNLDRGQLIRLYRSIHDIWNYRSNLTREIRLKICPYMNPFQNVFNGERPPVNANNIMFDEIRRACLLVFENLIYTGFDEDSRKLGAFHALTSLTIVSNSARTAMPWLYESVVFV